MQRPYFSRIVITGLGFVLAFKVAAQTINIPTLEIDAPQNIKNKNIGNVINSTQKQIKQQGSISLTDFLNKQGSVKLQSQSDRPNQTAISIHGFGSNAGANSLILIDGIPMSNFTSIGPNLNSILVDNIQNLIIKPGSYGSLYGDQAVGGVVDIQTQVPQKPETNLTFGLGNMAQKTAEFFLSRPLNSQSAFSISGSGYDTDNGQQHSFQNNYNVNSLLTYQNAQDKLKLSVFGYSSDNPISQGQIWQGHVNANNIVTNWFADIQGAALNLQNELHVDDNSRWRSSVSLQNSSGNGTIFFPFTDSQSNAYWQNKWNYKKYWESGIDLQHETYQANTGGTDQASADIGDIFGQATLPLANKLDLILGARFADQSLNAAPAGSGNISTNNPVFVNEQGFILHLKNAWDLFLRRDTNYRYVKADEAVWTPTNAQTLQTQTGTSYETGATWQQNQNSFSGDIFILNLNNEIAYDPTPTAAAPFGTMANLPPTQRIGLDLAGNFALTPQWILNLQSSLVDPTFSSGVYSGNTVPSVSAFNSSLGLTYEREHNWSVNVNENYHSPFYAAFDLQNQGAMMPGYFLTNVNFTKEWRVFNFDLEINNLFNTYYVRFAEFDGPGDILYYSSNGISVLAKLEIKM